MSNVRDIPDDRLQEMLVRLEGRGLKEGGQPPYDGGMEHRVTAIETKLETILPTLATKADLAEGFADVVKWIIGAAIGLGVAGITVMTFVLNNAVPKVPATVTQPIVIQLDGLTASGSMAGARLSVVPATPSSSPK